MGAWRRSGIAEAGGQRSLHGRATPRGVEWARRRVALVAGVATMSGLLMAVPAHAADSGSALPVVSAASTDPVTVLVTPTDRPDPYDAGNVGDSGADLLSATERAARSEVVSSLVDSQGDETALPAVSGVVADVSPDQLAVLQAQPDLIVTPDAAVSVEDASYAGASHAPSAVFPQTTGATALWANGVDGSGVTVAVLDTGIDRLPDFGNRIIGGVDLSGEGNAFQDSYGHGTFVAGLVAGNGVSSNGAYKGEAPGANLVSVKVAGASGVTDLATVISGINWVVTHRDQYGIRVLNISLGAIPTSSTVRNPLDQAVETAWQAGIAVVVSAGNDGPFNGTILSPGDDPLVITTGSLDDGASTNPSASTATTFSSAGPTNIDGWFKPDLVTSGRSVVSLRAPGSTIDTANPSARVGSSNFVGSGTSFSAAITSGAAALVIQGAALGKGNGKPRTLTPDEVKAQLLGTTIAGPVGNPMVDGHGALNVLGAVAFPGLELTQTVPTVATRVGSTVNLQSTWRRSSWNGSSWSGSTWSGSTWNGSSWNGSTWNGSTWNGSSWNGSSWSGSSWSGSSWSGSTWNGSSWNGSSWNGSSWNGSTWNGSTWNGSTWNGSTWNGSSWS
jgi:serine protease AprX